MREDYQAAYVDNRKILVMRETAVLLDVRQRAYEAIDKIDHRGKCKRRSRSGCPANLVVCPSIASDTRVSDRRIILFAELGHVTVAGRLCHNRRA